MPPRIYDPVHATEEKDYFTASAIEPLDNDVGLGYLPWKSFSDHIVNWRQYDFTLIEPTLLYMPYCPLSLYDDLLRLNWTPEGLSRIVLLGNRLDIYGDPYVSLQLMRDFRIKTNSVRDRNRAHPSFASKSEEKKGRYISKACSLIFPLLNSPVY